MKDGTDFTERGSEALAIARCIAITREDARKPTFRIEDVRPNMFPKIKETGKWVNGIDLLARALASTAIQQVLKRKGYLRPKTRQERLNNLEQEKAISRAVSTLAREIITIATASQQ